MRKEGLVFIAVIILLMLFSVNFYHFFNAFAIFLVAGGIPGTPLSISGTIMFLLTFGAIVFLLAWPFRESLKTKFFNPGKKAVKSYSSQRRRTRQPGA